MMVRFDVPSVGFPARTRPGIETGVDFEVNLKGGFSSGPDVPGRQRTEKSGTPPAGFHVARDLPPGRHPLLAVFPGLDQLPTAVRHERDPVARKKLYEDTCIEVVADDIWMYVAPFEMPKGVPKQWKPHLSKSDCIVVGRSHLKDSDALILYLDIIHELCHIRQRRDGLELFDREESYVRRPTEIEAYQFAVDEARRLGVTDAVLREYLKVEWVTAKEHGELLRSVGVSASG
ncbi:MAG: hypothetical protein L3J93_02055 [Thermoplasmata archaeon]|nr:hypothetical protein [Thermoplasmata archaeon]